MPPTATPQETSFERSSQPKQAKQKTMDNILNEVMQDAVKARDKGEKTGTDFVYQKMQERIFEAKYGSKPPSKNANHKEHIPYPPNRHFRRLVPHSLFDEDPWPERSFGTYTKAGFDRNATPGAPGGVDKESEPYMLPEEEEERAKEMEAKDKEKETASASSSASTSASAAASGGNAEPDSDENPLDAAAEADNIKADRLKNQCTIPLGADDTQAATAKDNDRSVKEVFLDSCDELRHWELTYLKFLRDHAIGYRRSLPILVEEYKHLTHRLVRAENRFVVWRDRLVGASGDKISPDFYAKTEDRVARLRTIYMETHKSMTTATYNPVKMRKAFTGKILAMDNDQFESWTNDDRRAMNEICAFVDDL